MLSESARCSICGEPVSDEEYRLFGSCLKCRQMAEREDELGGYACSDGSGVPDGWRNDNDE